MFGFGTWTYLVAYVSPAGQGNAMPPRPTPIDSAAEVQDVEQWIRTNGVPAAVVINVVLLKRRRFERWKDKGTTIRLTRGGWPIKTGTLT